MRTIYFAFVILALNFALISINASDTQKKDKLQTYPDAVEPIIQNQWQTFTWPYNAYLPEDPDGVNGHWGNACGPTSFARLLHYWQYPVNGKKPLNFTDTWGNYWNIDLTNMNLNYADMRYILYNSSPQDEYDETARLFEATSAVGEKITIGWSGDKERIPGAFVEYFGFKESLQWVDRWNYTKAEWIDLLKNELANGRPIMMLGRTTDSPAPWVPGSFSAHYWILDGYNESDEFYIDYAFNDIKGYYDVDNLGGIYVAYNSALIGLEPDWGNKELALVLPLSDEIFFNNEELTISWNSANVQNLKIDFSDDKGYTWETIAENISASNGSYSFIPSNVVSENCRIKISDQSDVNVNRISSIIEVRNPLAKSITIQSPDGGEYFIAGKTYSIIWESELISFVNIDYSTDNGTSWNSIINNYDDNSKAYAWTIPTENSTSCLVRISETGSNMSSQSPNTFTIGEQELIGGPYYTDANTVLLLHFDGDYKNMSDLSDDGIASGGGQAFENNAALKLDQSLKFSSGGDKITIPHNSELSLSGDWTIELWAKFTSYGSFPYLISKPGDSDSYQSNYSIQLQTSWDNVFHAFYFPTANLRVNVTAPKPELNKWYHLAFIRDTQNSQLKLIVHNENREEIHHQTNTFNTSSVLLNSQDIVIGGEFTGYIDEVRISNVVRNFEEVVLPSAAYNPSPANNATNVEIENTKLTWSNGASTDKIDLYFGKTNPPQELLLNNVNPQTSYQLSTLEPNTNYFWKVVCKNSSGLSNASVWKFTTKDLVVGTISLKTPNGGEYLTAGKTYPITWESENVQSVKIEYSADNGNSWNTIVNNYEDSSKKYDWMIPNVNSTLCLIRVSENNNGNVSSQSQNIFTISDKELIGGPYCMDENTVLLLHFDGDYNNMSSLSNDGTASGGGHSFINNSTSNLSECLKFNSASDKITIPHNNALSLSDDWTIELWANFSSFGSVPPYLISKPGDNDPYESNYSIQLNSYWDYASHGFYFSAANSRINVTGPKPEFNKWYHIALIRDTQKSELKLIMHDENREQVFTTTNNFSSNNVLLNSQNVVIGGDFIGSIDEVRISNVAREFDNTVSVDEEISEINLDYALMQNYPNPFNPSTIIKFSLLEPGFVDLRVFNVLGKEVACLINNSMQSGYHTLEFEANNLAAGIYFYKLNVNGKFSSVKKMLLVK